MHAQGLCNPPKKKKKKKKEKKKKKIKKKKKKRNLDSTVANSTFTISLGGDPKQAPFLSRTEEQITTITHQDRIHQQMLPWGKGRGKSRQTDRRTDSTEGQGSSSGPTEERSRLWEGVFLVRRFWGVPKPLHRYHGGICNRNAEQKMKGSNGTGMGRDEGSERNKRESTEREGSCKRRGTSGDAAVWRGR